MIVGVIMKRHRKIRRKKLRKQKMLLLIGILSVSLFITIGYAAFQTNINIDVKGNIKYKTIQQLKKKVVTSGDGLYSDWTENGRYIYRGSNPDNYITFNGEQAGWRIVSIENDGTIKIIKNETLGNKEWDLAGTRNPETSTYCVNGTTYGCNAWASTQNLVGTPSVFTLYYPNGNPTTDTTTYSGTVIADASLNTYLNGKYYTNSLNEDKKYIVNHDFYVGTPGSRPPNSSNENLELDVSQEKLYVWNGKIGLINATDYIKATTTSTCTNIYVAWPGMEGNCGTANWLKAKDDYYWTITPFSNELRRGIWIVASNGDLNNTSAGLLYGNNQHVDYNVYVRPALFLKSNIKLKGNGTSDSPYEIVD